MRPQPPSTPAEAEALGDRFAREHDIDDYYARSSWPIRLVEQRRLAVVRALVAAEPGERILEIGCGGGHVLRLFPQAELVGVDVSGVVLDKARRNLAGYRVELLKGELDALGLPEASFDKVVCTEVLEHTACPERILEHARRLLRPSGRAVVTFPNDRLIGRLKGAIRHSPLRLLPTFRRVDWGGDEYHFHVWSPSEMRALLSCHFAIEREAFAPARLLPIRCCFRCAPAAR
ncbi:MAG: class I SAM-dependent methyltransferase [Deltaproteobacteria bacterium]|nr:class I SAM-dependent methyltransferase [Deltaproteobacteria bacterium]